MNARLGLLAAAWLTPSVASLRAQAPADSARAHRHLVRTVVVGSAIVAATAPFDRSLDRWATSHHQRTLDRAATAVDPFGRARFILPALAASWGASRLTRHPHVANAVLRIAAGYLAADAAESALKGSVGRHRPDSTGGSPWRFDPFSRTGEWHSFPSAHMAHATALAAGIAAESSRHSIAIAAFGVAALVGAQRIYLGAHWPSDVTASAVLGVAVGGGVTRALQRSGWPAHGLLSRARLNIEPTHDGVAAETLLGRCGCCGLTTR